MAGVDEEDTQLELDAANLALEKELAKPLEIADQFHLLTLSDEVVPPAEKAAVAAALLHDITTRGA
jgi:hypothetical protein